jgi:hypothetical protein
VNISFEEHIANVLQFCHNNGNLSILESRGPEDHSDSDLAAVPDSLYFWKTLRPLKRIFQENISGPLRGGAVANHGLKSPEEWEWGVYIERVWAPWTINFFCICLVAGVYRLAAFILQHSGHIDDAVEFSLLHTMTALSILIFTGDEFLSVLEWIHTCVSNYMPFAGQNAVYNWPFSIPLRIPNVLPARISTAIGATALRTKAIEQRILSSSITPYLAYLLIFYYFFILAMDNIAELNIFVALKLLTLAFQVVMTARLMATDFFRERGSVSNWALTDIIAVPFLLFQMEVMSFTSDPWKYNVWKFSLTL